MKKKFLSLTLALVLVFTTAAAAYAESRLDTPQIESVDPAKNSILVSWTEIEDAAEYEIYRAASSKSASFHYYVTVSATSFRDSDIKKGTRYYYKVRALSYDGDADSKLSKWASGKVKKPAKKLHASASVMQSETVYLTNTGEKYHRSGCRYLRQSSIPKSLRYAKEHGYEACSVCF